MVPLQDAILISLRTSTKRRREMRRSECGQSIVSHPWARRLCGILWLAAILVVAGCGGGSGGDCNEAERRTLSLTKAFNAHDLAELEVFLDPQIRVVSKRGVITGTEEYIAQLRSLFRRYGDIRRTTRVLECKATPTIWVVTSAITTRYTDPITLAKTTPPAAKVQDTWKRDGDRWVLAESVER